MLDTFVGLVGSSFLVLLGVIFLIKGWMLRKRQPLQVAVVFALFFFIVAYLIASFSIKFPVI